MTQRDIEKAREQDEHFGQERAFQVAFKRFVNDIAGTNDEPDVGIIEATYKALDDLESQGVIGTDHLQEDIETAQETAEAAMAMVQDGTDKNDTQHARELVRNELVRRYTRRCSMDTLSSIAITNGEVQDLALPDVELEWSQVDRAFGQLVEAWDAFSRTVEDGEKALTITESVSDQLARVVAVELGRKDIANSVVGGEEGKA